ncbi:glutamate-rich protein 6B [Coturnix japonica]|uniref:glutamate-rich protein 6B n=1 Tax=Coturnix japonica TaxID=93934 RepID=UPI000776EC7B|nr:glutamate-rich protein 6B [Coturnix japonica]
MSNGHKLPGSGSNQSPPKTFSPGTVPSDSSSALTEENVRKVEKEYTTSKEAFDKRIQDNNKQSNTALSCNEETGEASTDFIRDEEPEGTPSSFPAKQKESSKEDCQNSYAVISRKDKPLTDAVMLSGDTEILTEAEVNERPAESKEEAGTEEGEEKAGTEEGEENSPAEHHEQAVCEPAEPDYRSPRLESEEGSSSNPEKQEDNGMAAAQCTAQETTVAEEPARCIFCGAPEQPIPTVADLKGKQQENLFCCWSYKKAFRTAIQDLMSENEAKGKMASASHADDLQDELQSRIKEKVLQLLGGRGCKNYKKTLQQYLKTVSLNTVFFRLSKPNSYTIRPKGDPFMKHQPTLAALEDLLEMDTEFVAEHLKLCHSPSPVRRCYPDGQTFYLLFPDGSGQVYYPSGNIAILIAFTEEAQFTYVILEDNEHLRVQAAFGSRGHGVSFHPNGRPWTILSPCTGICLDQAGERQKRWNWHDLNHHVHSPPFQPITMKLNGHLTLKIETQDKIHLWFGSHNNCIHFNIGARLKLKDPKMSHLLKGLEDKEELFLQSKKTQLRSLLSNIKSALQ